MAELRRDETGFSARHLRCSEKTAYSHLGPLLRVVETARTRLRRDPPDRELTMNTSLDQRMNTLAERLEGAIAELRTISSRDDRSESLSRITATVSDVVEELEIEWVHVRDRDDEHPAFGTRRPVARR